MPELEEKLDSLAEGALFQISHQDYERLFGINDAAAARLRNFAKGHACAVSHADHGILFRKHIRELEHRSRGEEPK
ncbi:MAG TPA: hypothetical protein VHB49_15305 [Bradyrhizobium sp.]|nr:hypothetical protein [Bradyrhizobium sp.]